MKTLSKKLFLSFALINGLCFFGCGEKKIYREAVKTIKKEGRSIGDFYFLNFDLGGKEKYLLNYNDKKDYFVLFISEEGNMNYQKFHDAGANGINGKKDNYSAYFVDEKLNANEILKIMHGSESFRKVGKMYCNIIKGASTPDK